MYTSLKLTFGQKTKEEFCLKKKNFFFILLFQFYLCFISLNITREKNTIKVLFTVYLLCKKRNKQSILLYYKYMLFINGFWSRKSSLSLQIDRQKNRLIIVKYLVRQKNKLEKQTEKDRQRERQAERKIDREKDRQIYVQLERQTDIQVKSWKVHDGILQIDVDGLLS